MGFGKADSNGYQMTSPECPECRALLPKPYPDASTPDFGMWECAECGCIWDCDGREEL